MNAARSERAAPLFVFGEIAAGHYGDLIAQKERRGALFLNLCN